MKQNVIAIDGPAGAGKSTVAKKVAEELGFLYIDTGAMYRAVTRRVLDCGIGVDNQDGIAGLVGRLCIRFMQDGEMLRVMADGTNVTEKIRTPEVTASVAKVAQVPAVRKAMVRLQREMAMEGSVVLDGRDIGTVVLPDACCKIFLTASVEERAKRRWKEMQDKGYEQSVEALQNEIELRDKEDRERILSPLMQASDAILVDTTGMTIDGVVAAITTLYRERSQRV